MIERKSMFLAVTVAAILLAAGGTAIAATSPGRNTPATGPQPKHSEAATVAASGRLLAALRADPNVVLGPHANAAYLRRLVRLTCDVRSNPEVTHGVSPLSWAPVALTKDGLAPAVNCDSGDGEVIANGPRPPDEIVQAPGWKQWPRVEPPGTPVRDLPDNEPAEPVGPIPPPPSS